MQAGYTKKTNHVIRGLRLWVMIYQLDFHGVERSWRLSLISGQWFNQLRLYNEIQIKTPDSTVQWVSLVGNTLCVLLHNDVPGGWHVMRRHQLHIWEPPRPCLMNLFLWLVLFCTLFATKKTAITSVDIKKK